jgi:predicted nucleotidyltransferase
VKSLQQARHDIVRAGYFGSYARGDWGFGSDLDLIVILDACDVASERRQLGLDVLSLPVTVDLLVYTADEWRALAERDTRFYREVMAEAVWVYP